MGAKGESSAQIQAQSWDVPPPATVISVGQGGGAAGRQDISEADGTSRVTSPRTRARGSGRSQDL